MEVTRLAAWIVTTAFIILHHSNHRAEAVNCYVCSWNPEDRELESDRCTSENFDEYKVRHIDCYLGCEVVKILDSNGELLMFYRNCLMASPNKLDFDNGYKKKTAMTEEEMYACDSDLCNAGNATAASVLCMMAAAAAASLLLWLK